MSWIRVLAAVAAWGLCLMAGKAQALPCGNPTPVKIHAEVTGYEAYPGAEAFTRVVGLGTSAVEFGVPFSPTDPTSSIEFKPTWWLSCDPWFIFEPFWALNFETFNGSTVAAYFPNGDVFETWPRALKVQVSATLCGGPLDFVVNPNPPCNFPHNTASGEFWMSISITPNDSVDPFWNSDGYCSATLDLFCAFTFEDQRATFGLFGFFGSFHPTAFVPLDANGFVTLGDDPSGPVILATPEPGTLLLAALAMAAMRRRRRR